MGAKICKNCNFANWGMLEYACIHCNAGSNWTPREEWETPTPVLHRDTIKKGDYNEN